jgi:hypothetical protein
MIDRPYRAIANWQFAIVDAADISSVGYLCQRRIIATIGRRLVSFWLVISQAISLSMQRSWRDEADPRA